MQIQTQDLPAMNFPAMIGAGSQVMPLADGDIGTAETIAAIRQLVDQGSTDPEVNRAAIAIIQQFRVPAHDLDGERRAIYQWVLRNIRFTRDIYGKETLRTAREILSVINGVLIPALLTTIGQRVRLVTIAGVAAAPDTFTHIYCEAWDGRRWLPLDAARVSAAYGKGPEKFSRKRVWELADETFTDVQGLSGFAGGNMRMGFDPRARYLTGMRGHRGMGRVPIDYLGLGQDPGSFDWTALDKAIATGATGAANIIRSIDAPSAPLIQTTPYGTVVTTAQGTQIIPPSSPFGGISTSTLMLLGLGLVAVVMLGKK
jgi:hypothetical protein